MKAVGQLQRFWQNLPLLKGKFFLRDLLRFWSGARPTKFSFSPKMQL
jgi:hypothetical protein